MSRWTCLLALLACAVVAAHAAGKPTAFTLADLGTATGMAANCSEPTGGSGMPAYWVEMTDLLNFTQYKNDADSDISNLPSPLPFPYSETASDARAPGWVSTCISRSPTAPEGCEGDACNVYIEEWGVEWLEFATLNCFGGYPNASGVDFFANPQPAPGNVALTVTETCKNYYYGPTDQWNYFWAVTDEWGNKWALQTSHMNDTTTDEFDANIESVVWPAGWGPAEKVTLTETVEMVPLMVGEACFAMIIKDSNFNSWHLYTYPEGGLTSGNSLLGAMGDTCTVLDAQYTLSNMDELEAEDSATTDTSSTDEADTAAPAPTEATSGASAGAPALLMLLGAAAAVAAVL